MFPPEDRLVGSAAWGIVLEKMRIINLCFYEPFISDSLQEFAPRYYADTSGSLESCCPVMKTSAPHEIVYSKTNGPELLHLMELISDHCWLAGELFCFVLFPNTPVCWTNPCAIPASVCLHSLVPILTWNRHLGCSPLLLRFEAAPTSLGSRVGDWPWPHTSA